MGWARSLAQALRQAQRLCQARTAVRGGILARISTSFPGHKVSLIVSRAPSQRSASIQAFTVSITHESAKVVSVLWGSPAPWKGTFSTPAPLRLA